MKNSLPLLLCAFALAAGCAKQDGPDAAANADGYAVLTLDQAKKLYPPTINARDFGALPNDGKDDAKALRDALEAAKKKGGGVRIALDDFGSGYSSFRMLLQYPTDIIKVDRSILGEMTASNEKKNFISSIVYACHKFGKQVCMEGVETREQNNLIKESGCDMIQGYYYHQPLELEELYRLLALESPQLQAEG